MSNRWEYLCIGLSHCKPRSKKYVICNVYRKPGGTTEEMTTFTNEFCNLLNELKRMKHDIYTCGDYNINLLNINSNIHCNNFFENVVSCGFYPKITLPTRIDDREGINNPSSTLIDNIFTSNTDHIDSCISGVLTEKLSDHQSIFTYYEQVSYFEEIPKYVGIEKRDAFSIDQFITELKKMNIYDQLDHSLDGCPQKNYTIFSLLINYAKNTYLQKKRVKYKKNKHFKSKWMTKGLLNSINTKDRLYQMMVQTSTDSVMHEPLRANLKAYQRILKNSINEAKRVYHHNLFARYKSDIKKTWSIIKDTLGKKNVQKKILQNLSLIIRQLLILLKLLMNLINILSALDKRYLEMFNLTGHMMST